MARVALSMSGSMYKALRRHLRPRGDVEQVAFVFGRPAASPAGLLLEAIEWYGVPVDGFVFQSEYHVELTDETRAAVIKRAHDLGASLVEFHSHVFTGGAAFSPSDVAGLRELVPHVRWRLAGRPYMAFVLAPDGHDALAWMGPAAEPIQADGIVVDGQLRPASGRTLTQGAFDD